MLGAGLMLMHATVRFDFVCAVLHSAIIHMAALLGVLPDRPDPACSGFLNAVCLPQGTGQLEDAAIHSSLRSQLLVSCKARSKS
jgi:hypothetical protein